MSSAKFLTIYLIAMVFTYLWRIFYFSAAFEDGADIDSLANTVLILMLISYAVMSYVAYQRGKAIDKGHLVAFPIVGAVFDIILAFVPFVPTVMNIITIVIGMPDKKMDEVKS